MTAALSCLAALALLPGRCPAPAQENTAATDSTWRSLFDGKTRSGWETTGRRQGWSVEDGAIACLGRGGGYLYTRERFQDFILRSEFRLAPRVNSGIFVRWSELRDPVNTGIEVQLLDSFGRMKPGTHDCGAIYDIQAPRIDAVRPAGEWNQMEITASGPILRVVLNAQQIVQIDLREWTTAGQNPDGTRNKFRSAYNTMTHAGHIGLQDHGGRFWIRDLQLRPLPEWRPPARG